ncbi:hypothetical protein PQX77_020516, partial [Marasmius sp. AFHP31]
SGLGYGTKSYRPRTIKRLTAKTRRSSVGDPYRYRQEWEGDADDEFDADADGDSDREEEKDELGQDGHGGEEEEPRLEAARKRPQFIRRLFEDETRWDCS